MKMKATANSDLIAKIDFIQSIDGNLTISDMSLLTQLMRKLLKQPAILSKRELERIEAIFELDQSRRVYSIKATDYFFARNLSQRVDTEVRASSRNAFDPFADIGKPADPFADMGKMIRAKRQSRSKRKAGIG